MDGYGPLQSWTGRALFRNDSRWPWTAMDHCSHGLDGPCSGTIHAGHGRLWTTAVMDWTGPVPERFTLAMDGYGPLQSWTGRALFRNDSRWPWTAMDHCSP